MERSVDIEQAVCGCGCACCTAEEELRKLADESMRVPLAAVCSCGCDCCAPPGEGEAPKEGLP